MALLIVESPTKAKTIKKFLGRGYKVVSSFGHVRDLPKGEFGIDIENNFKPKYVIPLKARKRVNALRKAAAQEKKIILASDQDREGEAIAWHLAQILGLKQTQRQRIVFHEITREAMKKALESPRRIDLNLVNSQQARRILDRIVGYKLSPLLWRKLFKGLSAGRVQSVALRLVCEREEEIKKFIPQEYWQISAELLPESGGRFIALLYREDGRTIPKLGIRSKKEAGRIIESLKEADYRVQNFEIKELKKNPLPPFTTSTLQQEAGNKFHWPAKLTMRLAQDLYEKGFITYHRTDSLSVSDSACYEARSFIEENIGKQYWPGYFRKFRTKTKGAQQAHEAIRPTYPKRTPEVLKKNLPSNHLRLYGLIWKRFIASLMSQAVFKVVKVDVSAKNYIFRAHGQNLEFEGFLKVYPIQYKETELPALKRGEALKLLKLLPSRHFTKPPSRYSEATLIKALEEEGIGRPSTYAPILETIKKRNYVEKERGRLLPTEIGEKVNELLVQNFPDIFNVRFTASMEGKLDEIARGRQKWVPMIKAFYNPFIRKLERAEKKIAKVSLEEKTDKVCPVCGSPLVIKYSRFGKFYACSNFPKCRHTEPFLKKTGLKCPKCRKGDIVERKTKKGRVFYSCSRWPKCDFALWDNPTGESCPRCGSILVEKGRYIQCSNPKCGYKKTRNP